MAEDLSSSHKLARSASVGLSPVTHFQVKQGKSQAEPPKLQCCNLLSVSLWEQICGEKLNPQRLIQLQDVYLPQISGNGTLSPSSQTSAAYVKMAKDRMDCLTFQDQIEKASPQEIEVIFNSLFPQMSELVSDGSANYVIQKLCDRLTDEQQTKMLNFFLKDIQKIVDQPNGCRVLQKFIETTNTANIDKLFLALKPNFVSLCSSQNGNHIAQRFIMLIPERIPIIIETIKPRVVQLVVDNWGCRVIQKLFDQLKIEQLIPLVDEVLGCVADLAINQFGNYVVQNILSTGKPEHINALIDAFSGHFYDFSMHKFASNVIEKCIRKSNEEQRQRIFTEIIGKEGDYDEQKIYQMVSNQFGNYVIQRIIEFGTESQQGIIYEVVCDNYSKLSWCGYAKHVISCLEQLGYQF